MRDFQQHRLYRWESQFPEGSWVAYENVQGIINHVWSAMGYEHPPLVRPLHPNDKAAARGDRLGIYIPKMGVSTKTILHELAHSITGRIDGSTNMHNEFFVGVYMHLLEKFMNVPKPLQWYSAQKDGLEFEKFPNLNFVKENH